MIEISAISMEITKSDRGCDRVVLNFATDAILYMTFLLIKRKYFTK